MFTKIRGICQLSQFLDEIQKDFANPPNSEVNSEFRRSWELCSQGEYEKYMAILTLAPRESMTVYISYSP